MQSDPTTPPKRIWAFERHNGGVGDCWHNATTEDRSETEGYHPYVLASEVAALEARVAELEGALKPFAREAMAWPDDWPETADNIDNIALDLTKADFTKAHAALASGKPGEAGNG